MLQQQYQPAPPPRCVIEKPKKKPPRKKTTHRYDFGEPLLSADILLSKNMIMQRPD